MVTAGDYLELQQFYSRQMQLLDCGQTEEWSQTFTRDGIFAVGDQITTGSRDISQAAAAAAAGFESRGIVRRHWVSMLIADKVDDGVQVRAYAVVIETPSSGGAPAITRSTVFDDLLVEESGRWKVSRRQVRRDGVDS